MQCEKAPLGRSGATHESRKERMTIEQRNARALAAGHARHDNATPDDTPTFLETTTGANWLADAGEQLVNGHDLKIGGKAIVRASDLAGLVAVVAEQRDKEDGGGLLGKLLVAVANYDMGTANSCLKSLMGKSDNPLGMVNEIAEDLARPFADAAAEQMRIDDEQEQAERASE